MSVGRESVQPVTGEVTHGRSKGAGIASALVGTGSGAWRLLSERDD